MSEDEQRRILRLLAIEKEQRRSHESLKKWATENFAILGHWKRAAEIKERAAENFSVLKSAPAKACSKKCTVGSKVRRSSVNQVIARLTISWTLGHNLSRPGVGRCSAQKHIDNAYITMRSNYQLWWESVKSLNCMICNYGWYTIQGKGDTFMRLSGHLKKEWQILRSE